MRRFNRSKIRDLVGSCYSCCARISGSVWRDRIVRYICVLAGRYRFHNSVSGHITARIVIAYRVALSQISFI